MVNNSYSATNLNGSVTVLPGCFQTFTVPTTGVYRIHAYGAQGGYNGGMGAYVAGNFTLIAGTVLKMAVGQAGLTGVNSYSRGGGGGGGGSFVASMSNVPMMVAGGGGGYGDGYTATTASPQVCCFIELNASTTPSAFPFPGGNNNGTPGNGGTCDVNSAGAGAGFFTNGLPCNAIGGSGSFLNINGPVGSQANPGAGHGGFGGGGGAFNSSNGNRGGGGGGYSGGGGGNANTGYEGYAPGGGGGSYNSGGNPINALSTFTGDGRILIEHRCDIPISGIGFGTFPGFLCSGNSVTLSAYGNGSYNWSTGAGNTPTIVVSPTSSAVYSVTGFDAFSCLGSGSIAVMVENTAPSLSVSVSSASICLGNTVSLNAGGALSYSWNSSALTITNNVPFTPSISAAYSLTGQNSCGSTTTVTNVTVTPYTVSSALKFTTICSGAT
jgi:hypothetical protein